MEWLVGRLQAISSINIFEKKGISHASERYNYLTELLTGSDTIPKDIDPQVKILIGILEKDYILKVETNFRNEDEYDYAKENRIFEEKHAKAVKWMNTLAKEEQEMIQTLMQGMIPRC